MKRCRLLHVALPVFLALAVCTSRSHAQQQRSYIDREVIVKLDDSVLPIDAEQLRSSLKATVKQRFDVINAELWEIGAMSVDEAVTRFHDDWRLDYIEPNYVVRAVDLFPNDPRFGELWGMHNTGQGGGVPDADIDAPEAWSMGTGGDVLVGIIDTGVDWNHVDLAANIFSNPNEIAGNGTDDDGNGYVDDVRGWDFVNNDNNPFDDNGHGTHVAGTIAAIGNNGIGVAGVSWSARILPLKFLDSGGFGSTSTAILAVQYATAIGARLTSNSWGGGGFSSALRDAIQAAGEQGILFVAAAGNDGVNNDSFPHYPSSYDLDNIISVASTDRNDTRSGFSNYGVVSVDLGAPGSDILSTFPNNSYGTISGTSMATPHVSGAVCLLWSVAPLMTHAEVKDAIMASIDPLPSLAGRVVSGGRLNVFTMLANLDDVPPARVANLAVQSTGSTSARLVWTATGDDGTLGTATGYDVRYSQSGIYWSNFNAATPATGEPQPNPTGSAESFEVTGLEYNTKYYFAMVVEDEQGNRSALSSLPNGTTLQAPHLAYSPASFTVSLHTGGTETRTLVIENTGAGTLDFGSISSPAWVRLDPPSGRVLAGQSMPVGVRFDATQLAGGNHAGVITLGTNDITQPTVPLNVSLQVTDAPDVTVSPLSLAYGAHYTGTCAPDTVVITNIGTVTLQVSGVSIDNSVFTTGTSGFSLAPNQSLILPVVFCPVAVATENATLSIASNDPDHPVYTVALAGEGVAPPVISVSPPSLSADLFTGGLSNQVLSITNQGGSNLDLEISLEEAGAEAQTLDVFAGASLSPRVLATGRPVPADELERMKRTFPKELFVGASGVSDRGTPGAPSGHEGANMTLDRIGSSVEEVFGSDDNMYTAGPRTRGNLFTCAISTVLREHRFYINPLGSTQLWFLVYESPTQVGTYTLISASDVTPAGPGLGWYSSGEVDVDMEAGRYYLIVASFEEVSEYFNKTDMDPYPYPASFGELTAGAGWDWAPTSNFPPDPFQDVPDYAFGATVAYYQTLVTGGAVRWLSINPEGGTVPPAATLDIAVEFDATNMFGGDYDANIRIASNDPVNPEVVVPAHLHVTGAPDITVSDVSIDYGPQFIGAEIKHTLIVSNTGTDLLTVTGITSSHPNYTVDVASFTLPPTEERAVEVTYAPTSTGPHPGTLTIQSDDPDEAVVLVALDGEGVEPPIIGVSPQSFTEDLFTGETSTQTLNIANSGESELTYQIGIENVASPSAQSLTVPGTDDAKTHNITPAASAMRAPSTAKSWMGGRAPSLPAAGSPSLPVLASVGGLRLLLVHTDEVSNIRNLLAAYADIETVDEFFAYYEPPSLSVLEDYDVVILSNGYQFASPDTLGDVLADYVDGGGAVVVTIASFIAGWELGGRLVEDGYLPFTIGSGPTGPATLGTFDPGHPIMAGVTNAMGDLLAVTSVASGAEWVASWSNGQPLVATKDHRVVGVNVFLPYSGYWSGDIPLIIHNAAVWAAGAGWLQVEPAEGVVPPHANVNVAVNFDAEGLFGGDYVANIQIANNDPLNPKVAVPAALHVTGAPDITLSSTALDYGPQFIGAQIQQTLVVTNDGTDLLSVSSIASNHPDYTVDVSSFTLVPNESRNVVVTFAPTSTGPITGSLTVTSDDVDEAILVVSLGGTGVLPPIASVEPTSLAEDLVTGETATHSLTISNSGESDLSFGIVLEDQGSPASSGENSSGGPTAPIAPIELGKGEEDTRSYPPMAMGRGGPDAFGYQWRDNNSAGGPTFNWIDASGGTGLPLSDDNFVPNVPLGFTFTYYGAEYTTVGVGSNGWLSFTGIDGWYPSSVPSIDYIPGPIAAFARDLYPPSGWVRYKTIGAAPRRQFVVEYHNVPDYGGGYYKTFEMILSEGTNSVRFQYLVAPNLPIGFGIESPDQTMGIGNAGVGDLFISPALVRNNYVIEFAVGPAWLTLDTMQGNVPPHGQMDIAALFDAHGLYGGDYDARIRITTNDPLHSELVVPVGLHVTGAPDVAVSPGSLDYGSVFVGGTRPMTVAVVNVGTDLLTVSSVASSHSYFTPDKTSFSTPPGDTTMVAVTFAPQAPGTFDGSLTISSDDPDEPTVVVGFHGLALEPPVIAVSPASFSEALFTGEASTQVLTISNTGASPLEFDVSARRVEPASALASGMGVALGAASAASAPGAPGATSGVDILMSTASTEQERVEPRPAIDGANPTVLVIQDYASWYYRLDDLLLLNFGVPSVVINSSQVATTDFSPYDLIVTAGFQSAGYYTILHASRARFTDFVDAGGVVLYIAATYGSSFEMAGGALSVNGTYEYENSVTAPSHPIVAGVPPVIAGSYASHNQIADFPANATVITRATISGVPTTVEYRHGAGTVIATGVTWDYLYYYGYPGGRMLINALGYSLSQSGVPWLRVTPATGTVQPGQSANLTVRFDATGLVGGNYDAILLVENNDPLNDSVDIPVTLAVTGAPNIVVTPGYLEFGSVFLGGSNALQVAVANSGTDYLFVTSISTSDPHFTADPTVIAVPPGGSQNVTVTFTPTATGALSATLTVQSNDPNDPAVSVALTGTGATPPVIAITPTSLTENLQSGGASAQSLTIDNLAGGAPLTWAVHAQYPGSSADVIASSGAVASSGSANFEKNDRHPPSARPEADRIFTFPAPAREPALAAPRASASEATPVPELEEVLTRLNAKHAELTARIPRRHDFAEGVSGSNILDGGGDMYDGGNRLGTDRGQSIVYSNNAIVPGAAFGTTGRYFTRKYPGLFVLAADMDGVNFFEVSDNLGFDGRGSVDGSILETRLGGHTFLGFVKRVYGADVPAVNHLIIVDQSAAANHEFATFTDDDYHRAFNLAQSRRLYYLLFSTEGGERVGDDAMLDVMQSFLVQTGMVSEWINVAPAGGTLAAGASASLGVSFNAAGLFGGDYHADLVFTSNDPVNGTLMIPADLHVSGVPDISVTPTLLYFGKVPVGFTVMQNLIVANEGTEQLTVSNVTCTHPDFVLGVTNFVLAPGQSRNVEVSFTPSILGTVFGQVTVTSDDPDEGTVALFAVGEGSMPPIISVSPESITDTVTPGEIATHTMTIGNSGVGDLDVNIRLVETGGTSEQWLQNASISAKTPGPDPSGGPDPFGYRWKDSDEPGGPVFSWANVATGANVALPDEGFVAGIPLGFTFRYYDVEYTSIGVGSNGWLSFNGTGNSYPTVVPLVDAYAGAIAPYARNLYPPPGGYVRYQTFGVAPNRQFIIEYNNIPVVGVPNAVTFEVILTETVNSIRFQYLAVAAAPIGFGIESPDQQRGMGNGGSGSLFIPASRVRNSYAIEFSPATRWLGANPTTAQVRTGEFANIIVTLDARNLTAGDYAGKISVFSNDPLNPLIEVPVSLSVDSTVVSTGVNPLPVSFALQPNRPNPFNPVTTIGYDLPQTARVKLVVYDVAGRQVRELVNGSQAAGRREIVWDGRNASGDFVASGVYFYRLVAGDFVQTRKMVLLK